MRALAASWRLPSGSAATGRDGREEGALAIWKCPHCEYREVRGLDRLPKWLGWLIGGNLALCLFTAIVLWWMGVTSPVRHEPFFPTRLLALGVPAYGMVQGGQESGIGWMTAEDSGPHYMRWRTLCGAPCPARYSEEERARHHEEMAEEIELVTHALSRARPLSSLNPLSDEEARLMRHYEDEIMYLHAVRMEHLKSLTEIRGDGQ